MTRSRMLVISVLLICAAASGCCLVRGGNTAAAADPLAAIQGQWRTFKLEGRFSGDAPIPGAKELSDVYEYFEVRFEPDAKCTRTTKRKDQPASETACRYTVDKETITFLQVDEKSAEKATASYRIKGDTLILTTRPGAREWYRRVQ